MNYRLSLGDFSTDHISESKAKLIPFIWIIWAIAVLLLNIIFMNFIIAVISQTYERVILKSTAESYKLKSKLIAERELIMTEKELANEDYFPRYLVLRRPVLTEAVD